MISSFKAKLGALVEVRANGTFYTGQLKGISEKEIYLKTQLKTWTIPHEKVQSFRYLNEKLGTKTDAKKD
jgi:hypothetical protein